MLWKHDVPKWGQTSMFPATQPSSLFSTDVLKKKCVNLQESLQVIFGYSHKAFPLLSLKCPHAQPASGLRRVTVPKPKTGKPSLTPLFHV